MKLCPKCGFSNSDKELKCQNCYTNIEQAPTYDQNRKPKLIRKVHRTKYINIPISTIMGLALILFKLADYFIEISEFFPLFSKIFMTIIYIYIGLIIIKQRHYISF